MMKPSDSRTIRPSDDQVSPSPPLKVSPSFVLRVSVSPWLLFAFSASLTAAVERPNIVFICTDDQAPWVTGYAGHPEAKTPNLDRLFREGAYLANAFTVTPVCSPSRAATMTGRYGTE